MSPAEYLNKLDKIDGETKKDNENYEGMPSPSINISHIINKGLELLNQKSKKPNKIRASIDEYVKTMGWNNNGQSSNETSDGHDDEMNADLLKTNIQSEISTSKIHKIEGIRQFDNPTITQLKKQNQMKRATTKGPEWFNMSAPEITEEVENDLKILQMRSVLNPKRFYKKNDLKVLPKYFQIGTVQHSPIDFYQERHVRKNKNKTIVDELLADSEFKKYTKRKYKEIMEKKQQKGYHKALKKMKKLKKK